MKKKYIWKTVFGIIGLLSAMLPLKAETAKDAFLSMPESMFLYLNSSNRIDLIDLYDTHLHPVVLNTFGDTVTLKNLTTDYLLLKMKNSSLQLIVLPMKNNSKLYCVIHTICGSVCDSYIEFYSASWEQLQVGLFITPVTRSYFIDENLDNVTLDVSFMQFIYDPVTLSLQQFYNISEYMSIKDKQKIQSSVKEKVKMYKWNGIRFE